MLSTQEVRKQNQKTLLLLVLAFVIPVLAAYLVYLGQGEVRRTRNNGELIIPARPLESFQLLGIDGKPYNYNDLHGNWHLVYLGKGDCGQVCRGRLSMMHQTRMGQGKAMSRVRLLYIALDGIKSDEATRLADEYARLTVLSGGQDSINTIIKLFQTDASSDIREDNMIFMVDPLGNLMMRYKNDVRLIGIIKDLEHLLKISQIG